MNPQTMEYQPPSKGKTKKLPVAYTGDINEIICLALLAVVYEESSILPVSIDVQESEAEDYLSQKYIDQFKPLVLEAFSEIVFPAIRMYDSEMFILNYQKFYDFS
jgi:hypothetical protein